MSFEAWKRAIVESYGVYDTRGYLQLLRFSAPPCAERDREIARCEARLA